MAGHGAPPEWYVIELAAEAWGCTPWALEEEAPALWIDRFVATANAKARVPKPQGTPGMKRLI